MSSIFNRYSVYLVFSLTVLLLTALLLVQPAGASRRNLHHFRTDESGIKTTAPSAPITSRSATQNIDFSQLDTIALDEIKLRKTPGATIAIVSQGRVVYVKGYGVASVETEVPVTPEFLFRLGSTTKMLTAAGLVTLASEGKINLDQPIAKYVKGLNVRLGQVTAHQLLSHSAGLRDFGSGVVSNDETALASQVRSWNDDVFFTEPGKVYSYSSPGYWLSGVVIEEAGGKPYADVLESGVFKPLGMTRTTLRPLVAMTYPLAAGHKVEGQGLPTVIRPAFNNTAMWPGGSVYSNVNDLSRFVIALMDGGRLDQKQVLAPLVVSKLPAPHVTCLVSRLSITAMGSCPMSIAACRPSLTVGRALVMARRS